MGPNKRPTKGKQAPADRLLKQQQLGAALVPSATREEWDQLLAESQPETRDLLAELARFADLWRYFGEQDERLGAKVVNQIRALHKLPVKQRIVSLRMVNRSLIRKLKHAGESAQFRQ